MIRSADPSQAGRGGLLCEVAPAMCFVTGTELTEAFKLAAELGHVTTW